MSHNTQHDITHAQAQMMASLIHSLDNNQDPALLAQEVFSSRGMDAINSIVEQLLNLNAVLEAEYRANGEDDGDSPA